MKSVKRQELSREEVWHFDDLYANDEAFLKALAESEEKATEIASYEGRLGSSPEVLLKALKEKEARAVFAYIPASFICFVLGLAFGYFFVSPAILEVLMRLGEGLFDTQLTAQNYLTFLWHTTLPLGVLFELPVLVAFLTSIGLLTPQFLITYRRYAYFVLLVLAVVLTPADFISDLAMTLPLILLFEVSVAISKVIYLRKRRN